MIAGLRIVWRHVYEFQRSQAQVVRLNADDARASQAQESVR